jgi:predicted Rossmann-fold nucleotide-binding protein
VGLLNTAGFYDGLQAFLATVVQQQFLSPWQMNLIRIGARSGELLPQLIQAAGLSSSPRMDQI